MFSLCCLQLEAGNSHEQKSRTAMTGGRAVKQLQLRIYIYM